MSLDPRQTKQDADQISKSLENKIASNIVKDKELQDVIKYVKHYISYHKAIIYGGTAINMLLPEEVQFYDKETDLADLDFFIVNAKKHAKKIVDELHNKGYKYVQGRSGVHYGTFKVFVDFQQIADITEIPEFIYKKLLAESIVIDHMHVASPDWLRMGLYKELMLPTESPSRWPKIAPRLALLNKYRPYMVPKECSCMFDNNGRSHDNPEELATLMDAIAGYVAHEKLVLLGATAFNALVLESYGPTKRMLQQTFPMRITGLAHVSDYDVLTPDLKRDTDGLVKVLVGVGIDKKRIHVKQIEEIPDVIPTRVSISVDKEVLVELYDDTDCMGYIDNKINGQHGQTYNVRIAALPTLLKMWFGWLYSEPNIEKQQEHRCKLFCMIEFLLNHQTSDTNSPFSIFTQQCNGQRSKTLRDVLRNSYETGRKLWRYEKK